MTHLVIVLIAAVATSLAVVSAVSPIWMAPTNLNYSGISTTFNADIYENFTANLGEWAKIEVGVGPRAAHPLVLMDSKGIIWILGGAADRAAEFYLTAVWNYNPKTDQYRYVWKTNDSSPFVARDAGELRVPAPNNHPGGIGYTGAVIDKNDNIWLYSFAYAGELWMFNTTSWMFVRQFGFYSDNDSPSLGANPGQPGEDVWPGYYEGQCMVIDSQENIWMLAGYNDDGAVNAVWHFNTTSLLWTFITGSIIEADITHNSTFYGGTWMGGCDIDDNDRVWIYGGYGGAEFTFEDDYGHLWSFDTRVKREWEFEYGEDAYTVTAQVVSDDYDPDNRPPAGEGCALIDRLDGTLMLVPGTIYVDNDYGRSDTVWLYSKSLKQWKLVYGNITVVNMDGVYSDYRTPGSAYRGSTYFGNNAGKNSNGDLYIVGGGLVSYGKGVVNFKDIWLMPQNQCSNNLHTCDVNANCIEEVVGYSCECQEGYTGDGFTCTIIPTPVAEVPLVEPSSTSPTNTETPVAIPTSTNTPSNRASGASLVGASIAVVAFIGAICL